MAICRAALRWFKARLCTGFLMVILCAVAWFAISASYHSIHGNVVGSDLETNDIQEQSRLAAQRRLAGTGDGKGKSGRRTKNGFDDDDEEVQICKYPLLLDANSMETVDDTWNVEDQSEGCGGAQPENLFYFDNGALLMYDNVIDRKKIDRCEYRGIEWKSDSEFVYTQAHVKRFPASFDIGIEHDFVHVQCYPAHQNGKNSAEHNDVSVNRMERKGKMVEKDGGTENHGKRRRREYKEEEKEKSSDDKPVFQYHDAKDFHRSVLQRNSPRLVGSLGLPDFRDNLLGQKYNPEPQQNKESRHLLASKTVQEQDKEEEKGEEEKEEGKQEIDTHQNEIHRIQKEEKEESEIQSNSEEKKDARRTQMDDQEGDSISDIDSDLNKEYVKDSSLPIFDQFLVQISEKKEVKDRVVELMVKSPNSPQMNVLVLAVDSISKVSFQKNMRRSSRFLEDELKAVVMDGYNCIGDAATAAVIPLITGLKEEEVIEMRRSGRERQYVDSLSYVWNKFEQNGYVTLYAEDEPSLGSFQTHYYGFEQVPVDHYMRPFWLAASESKLHSNSYANCIGATPKHRYMFEYIENLFREYDSMPKFAFGFLSEYNKTELFDEELSSFLELLKKRGHLKNTLLIILSDHGKSYGDSRETITGKLEESLPYLSLAFPSEFRSKYFDLMENLETNRGRLTTAFDVHATLRSLLDLNSTRTPVNSTSRAVSLLQEVPRQRTCKSADVPTHWCTCVKYEQLNDLQVFSETGRKYASIAVDYINGQIEAQDKERRCAKLSLYSVKDIRHLCPNEVALELENRLEADRPLAFRYSRNNPLSARYHQVVFKTSPNDAIFEATIDSSSSSTPVVNGQISRINEYEGQSNCIVKSHPDLRKYCQC